MRISEKAFNLYEQHCAKWADLFDKAVRSKDLVKNLREHDLDSCIISLQGLLEEASAHIIYAKGESSLTSIVRRSIDSDSCCGLGLVSMLSLANSAAEDEGIPYYHFCLGTEDAWNSHVTASYRKANRVKRPGKKHPAKNFADIQKELTKGVSLGERVFGLRNATGVLLSHAEPRPFTSKEPVLLPWRYSREGAGARKSSFKEREPWALVDLFPQVYGMITQDGHPLGFLQIHLQDFPSGLIKDRQNAYKNQSYSWLYVFDPQRQWVRDIRRASSILCRVFLSRVLTFAALLKRQDGHLWERNIFFPDRFRNALWLGHNNDPRKDYHGSRWEDALAEVHTCLENGLYAPGELAASVINHLWIQDEKMREHSFGKRELAERVLFWNENYRDHLVHMLKVFLLGERMIFELTHSAKRLAMNGAARTTINNDLKQGRRHFEGLWMLAATIHDFSIPYERLPELQRSYQKLFLAERKYQSGEERPKSEDQDIAKLQFGLNLADFILRDEMVGNLFHIMHWDVVPKGKSAVATYRNLLEQIKKRKTTIMYPEYLNYFLTHGDHGIASALWFLLYVLGGPKGLSDENPKPVEKSQLEDWIEVATASYFHSMSMARRKEKDGDAGRPYFHQERIKIPFAASPLMFLLLLCDVLQDEGRPETEAGLWWTTTRPIGHIQNIGPENGRLVISITYSWVRANREWREPLQIKIDQAVCGKDTTIMCTWRKSQLKDDPQKNPAILVCDKPFTKCDELNAILNTLDLLKHRLTGLPITIKVPGLPAIDID